MDTKLLKAIQDAGWVIETVDAGDCVVRCPSSGCQMRARFKSDALPTLRASKRNHPWDREVSSYDDVRRILRSRREELALTIGDVERASGLAGDHLAKSERDDWHISARMPNIQAALDWAEALGYQVVLRPKDLPMITMRMVAESRDKVEARRQRNARENERRRRQA